VSLQLEQDVLMDIRERLVRVETKLDSQNDLKLKVETNEIMSVETEARSKSNTHRINKLEADNTWLWRTIVGTIIAAGIAALAIFK